MIALPCTAHPQKGLTNSTPSALCVVYYRLKSPCGNEAHIIQMRHLIKIFKKCALRYMRRVWHPILKTRLKGGWLQTLPGGVTCRWCWVFRSPDPKDVGDIWTLIAHMGIRKASTQLLSKGGFTFTAHLSGLTAQRMLKHCLCWQLVSSNLTTRCSITVNVVKQAQFCCDRDLSSPDTALFHQVIQALLGLMGGIRGQNTEWLLVRLFLNTLYELPEDDLHQRERNYRFLAAAGALAWQKGPGFQAWLQKAVNLKLNWYRSKMLSNSWSNLGLQALLQRPKALEPLGQKYTSHVWIKLYCHIRHKEQLQQADL